MTRLRARIAERMVQAQATQALLTSFNEVDLQAVNDLRARYKDAFEKQHGVKLGFMSFFVKACVEALKKFPAVNASVEGNDIVYHEYFDIGVAVSTDRGLIVPVLRDADQLSFAEIEKSIANFAARARAGTITIEELTGGTFTITNGGVSARCCRRRSSMRRRARSSACTRSRSGRWWWTARWWCAR